MRNNARHNTIDCEKEEERKNKKEKEKEKDKKTVRTFCNEFLNAWDNYHTNQTGKCKLRGELVY